MRIAVTIILAAWLLICLAVIYGLPARAHSFYDTACQAPAWNLLCL